MNLIEIRGSNFFDGVARVLGGHVTAHFLTNESPFRGSCAESRGSCFTDFLDEFLAPRCKL